MLILVFAAALFGVILQSGSRFVARRTGISRRHALWLVLGLLFLLIGFGAWRGFTGVTGRASLLAGHLHEQYDRLHGALASTSWGAAAIDRVDDYLAHFSYAGMARGLATTTLGVVTSLVLLFAASLYFALSPQTYTRGTLALLPKPWRPRGAKTLDSIGETLTWWFVGQLIDMAVIGSLTFAGLLALGVPLAGTLAIIATLCNFVPYIGAICGAVPAVLVALGQGSSMAVEVGILYLFIQAFEGNVVAPIVQRRTVELPPVLTIFSQTIFGTLFGPLGLVLATPIAAALMVAVRIVYIEGVLGDDEAAH